jgi:repressor LexA
MSHFSEALKLHRKRAGLSQKGLADRLELTQKAVSFWELGEKEPSLSNLEKLCAALNVTCDVFFEKPAKKKK